jgi:hypothetical protein
VATLNNHRVPARAGLPDHPPAACHATGTSDLPLAGRPESPRWVIFPSVRAVIPSRRAQGVMPSTFGMARRRPRRRQPLQGPTLATLRRRTRGGIHEIRRHHLPSSSAGSRVGAGSAIPDVGRTLHDRGSATADPARCQGCRAGPTGFGNSTPPATPWRRLRRVLSISCRRRAGHVASGQATTARPPLRSTCSDHGSYGGNDAPIEASPAYLLAGRSPVPVARHAAGG